MASLLTRRTALAGAAALLPGRALAAEATMLGTPRSVISNPPRDFRAGAEPVMDPDPDVLVIDKSFASLRIGQELIHRVHTGLEWAEGPAWCA